MPKTWFWCAASLLLTTQGWGATILEKKVHHTISADGRVHERTMLKVRLDSADDLRSWSSYYVLLDENRSLGALNVVVTGPDGKNRRIKSKHHEETNLVADGVLHGSQRARVVELPALSVGSIVSIEEELLVEPYFPSGEIPLVGPDGVEDLLVQVQGMGVHGRWRLAQEREDLEVEELADGIEIRGASLPGTANESEDYDSDPVTLLYAWGEKNTWRGIGEWYEELLRPLARHSQEVQQLSRQLTLGIDDPRARLEALLSFLRRQVRYVAVEVGIGGYQPTPPSEVLKRRWGDCKDKSLLLIDLLHEAGIKAHPALILASRSEGIDTDFPSPFQFNHLIVAVPVKGIKVSPNDPAAHDLLFIDATQEHGGATWLNPTVQEQEALVVRGDDSALLRTPGRFQHERQILTVEVTVLAQGDATGKADLLLTGSRAAALASIFKMPGAEEVAHRLFTALLPGVQAKDMRWGFDDSRIPALRVRGQIHFDPLIQGVETQPSFQLPAPRATPELASLNEEQESRALTPGSQRTLWQLALPESFCPPRPREQEVANDVGLFAQTVSVEDRTVTLDRRVEIRPRWIEGNEIAQLRELALLEHRASRRRVRFGCSE